MDSIIDSGLYNISSGYNLAEVRKFIPEISVNVPLFDFL
jgi:hypothetical protein